MIHGDEEISFFPYNDVISNRYVFSEESDDHRKYHHWSSISVIIDGTEYSLWKLPKVDVYAAYENDVITFHGIGLYLSVPFGMGWDVHEKIMKAIHAGYEPPENSILNKKD